MTCHTPLSRPFRTLAALVFLASLTSPGRAQGGCLSGGSGGCPSDSGTPKLSPGTIPGGATLLLGTALCLRSRRRP